MIVTGPSDKLVVAFPNDVDVEVSKVGAPTGQLTQFEPASHKSEDPVSRMRLNTWGL